MAAGSGTATRGPRKPYKSPTAADSEKNGAKKKSAFENAPKRTGKERPWPNGK